MQLKNINTSGTICYRLYFKLKIKNLLLNLSSY